MGVSEKVLEDKLVYDKSGHRIQKFAYISGKKISAKKLQKKVSRKPRLIGTIFINIFIILAIVIAGILVMGI